MGAVKTSERGVMFVVRSAAGDVGKYIVEERTAKFPSMGKVSSPCVSQRPPSHASCVAGCQPIPPAAKCDVSRPSMCCRL